MRIAACVLGILGGLAGIVFGLFALAVGGINNASDDGSGNRIVVLGLSALAASALSLICAGFVLSGARLGVIACGFAVAAVWHLVSISAFGIAGALLMLIAALFAAVEWWNTRTVVI